MERPHKQGYVMRWNSQNEVVPIFNSVTKIHFNKAHDPPRSSSLPPTPSSLPSTTHRRFTRSPSDPSRTLWGLFFHHRPPSLGQIGTPLTHFYFPFGTKNIFRNHELMEMMLTIFFGARTVDKLNHLSFTTVRVILLGRPLLHEGTDIIPQAQWHNLTTLVVWNIYP